jgi:hypothetical protein
MHRMDGAEGVAPGMADATGQNMWQRTCIVNTHRRPLETFSTAAGLPSPALLTALPIAQMATTNNSIPTLQETATQQRVWAAI